jgi:hypothetical protein
VLACFPGGHLEITAPPERAIDRRNQVCPTCLFASAGGAPRLAPVAHVIHWHLPHLADRILEQHLLTAENMVGSNFYDGANLRFVQQRLDE